MLDNLSSRQILAGGDIKEITDVIKKDLLTLLMTQALTNDHHPAGFFTLARTVLEFGDLFAAKPNPITLVLGLVQHPANAR